MADEEVKPVNGEAVWPMVFKLGKSVIANGDEVNELSFREPTTADIERLGNPVTIDFRLGDGGSPKVNYDDKIMLQMLAVLAAVPPSTIRSMKLRDYESVKLSITSFFMPVW